jgi:signal transduction histidine kinase
MKKHKLTEGSKMFWGVMAIFAIYAICFIVFEDYDRVYLRPFDEASDWHLLVFSLLVMGGLAWLLHRYAHRMDERIGREQAEKENKMRRELTHNIAHELKTPVASILGYTETLLENPDISPETQHQFVERTHLQAQRLTALLKDVSMLNRMDYAAEQLEFMHVDVSELVAEISQEISIQLAGKHMTLKNYMREDIVINGNPMLLYSIFRNLFDNSLNYAGEGTVIELRAEQQDDSWQFTFSDNGKGVAAEHLSRIFERFYRIDKGRSRSLGGTGLGLAIVKNAVNMHGGTISACEAKGGGLAFVFTLKK